MNKKRVLIVVISLALMLTVVVVVSAKGKSDIAKVKSATSQFHRTEVAQAEGWDLRPDLDHCFENPGVGGMGFHYINTAPDVFDNKVDVLQPEAMVYAPGPNGKLKLAAVEYIVDKGTWDAAYPGGELPSVLGQEYHEHAVLPIYILHAWIWKNNPAGMFEDWNPNVSCPE